MEKLNYFVITMLCLLILFPFGKVQEKIVQVGERKFKVQEVDNTKENNSNDIIVQGKSTKVKLIVKSFYIHPNLSGFEHGKALSLKEVIETDGGENIFQNISNFLEAIWSKYDIGFAIGTRPPQQWSAGNQSRTPKVGYSSEDGIIFDELVLS